MNNKLRFDVVYFKAEDTYFEYLRFFECGNVISASSTADPSSQFDRLLSWFNENYEYCVGEYTVKGNEVDFIIHVQEPFFAIKKLIGDIEYKCFIQDDGSILAKTHSYINGSISEGIFYPKPIL